jgi:hypothetical protein
MNDRATGYPGNLTPEQNKVFNDFKSALSRRFSSPTYDEVPLTLWGVTLPRRTAKGDLDTAQTAILLKFLRDSRWSPNDAAAKLAAALKWRVEYKIENLNREKFSEELAKVSYPYGVDRRSNPIIYTNYSAMAKVSLLSDVDKFVRWRISVLEKALASADFQNGGEKVTFVYDWAGCGLFLDSKVNESQNKLNNFMKLYYPECTEFRISVNVPPLKEFFNDIFSFISPSGNIVVSAPKVKASLLTYVSPDSIIPQYGGFDPVPPGVESVVSAVVVSAGKNFSAEVPANKGDTVFYSYICREGDVSGSYGFKKEGKRFLDDKNTIAKKDTGKGSYDVEKKGAFVISFANEDPVGEKTVFYRAVVVSREDFKTEKKKSKKDKKKGGDKEEKEEKDSGVKIEVQGAEE